MSASSTMAPATGSAVEQASRPGQSGRAPWLLLALGALACLGYLSVEIYLLSGEIGFPLDDSWIHLQFARNLAAGNGLSFNPGELLPGSTAPLWTALLSLLFFLPGSPIAWAKLAGVVLYLTAGSGTHRLAREMGLAPGWALLAAGLTLATSWLVWSALSGLEILLFVVLSVWGIRLHLQERRDSRRLPLSLALFAVAFLARPEALLLAVLAAVDRLFLVSRDEHGALCWSVPRLRPLLLGVLVLGLVAGPVLLFNAWSSGSVLPTTFGAKSGGLARWLPEMGYLYTVFGIFFQAQPWMALFAGAGLLYLLRRLGGGDDLGLLPGLWLVSLPIAYGLIDPPGQFNLVGNFGRYFFPLFPILVVLGTLGLQSALKGLSGWLRLGARRLSLRALVVAVVALPTLFELVQGAGRYGQSVLNVHESDVRVARWLAGRLDERALLAVADIGAIKFLLPNRVIDLAGIANPEIRAWGAERFLEHYRPDYLVIFPNWLERLVQEDAPFEMVREFSIADNITMGGDTLAVYATPWTRYALAAEAGSPSVP